MYYWMTLGYSKQLRMHKLSMSLTMGIYNLVRKHKSLDGMTPAQAAGVEKDRWTFRTRRDDDRSVLGCEERRAGGSGAR